MSLSDKIRILFEKHHSLSSEMVKYLLEKEYGIIKSKRTIQRLIGELVQKRILIPKPTMGRSQTYTILGEKPSSISDFFLSKFWEELFKIRDELFAQKSENLLADAFDSFYKLRSLVKMLPKDIKEKIKPRIESFGQLTDEDKEKVAETTGTKPILMIGFHGSQRVPASEEEFERREKRKNILGWILKRKLEDIIGEVATLLHEALEKERHES